VAEEAEAEGLPFRRHRRRRKERKRGLLKAPRQIILPVSGPERNKFCELSATAQYKTIALAVSPDTMRPEKAMRTTVRKLKRKCFIQFALLARDEIRGSPNGLRPRTIYLVNRVHAPRLSISEVQIRCSALLSSMRRTHNSDLHLKHGVSYTYPWIT
jgi:hypothetical protein